MTEMTTLTTPKRRRRTRRAGALAVVAVAAALVFGACTPEAYTTADLVNQSRAQNGLPGLEFNTMLYMKAQAWSQQLNAQGYLSHSNLTDGNWSTSWSRLGENVGYAWSLQSVEDAFMNSAPHRANILGAYNKIGTGVTQGADGRYWVVQEFMNESFQG